MGSGLRGAARPSSDGLLLATRRAGAVRVRVRVRVRANANPNPNANANPNPYPYPNPNSFPNPNPNLTQVGALVAARLAPGGTARDTA